MYKTAATPAGKHIFHQTLCCLSQVPKQVTLSASRIWSSAQPQDLPSGMARHRLLQPPLPTRHALEPGKNTQKSQDKRIALVKSTSKAQEEREKPTLLLVGVVHPDLEDGRPLVAEQRDRLGDLVQLVDAAAAVLVPEEELLVVTQAEGVVQLLTLVDHLLDEGRRSRCIANDELSIF